MFLKRKNVLLTLGKLKMNKFEYTAPEKQKKTTIKITTQLQTTITQKHIT